MERDVRPLQQGARAVEQRVVSGLLVRLVGVDLPAVPDAKGEAMKSYSVMFCCNDDRGMPTGRVENVEVGDEIRLFTDDPPTFQLTDARVKIGRRGFSCRGRQSMVGNVFWDATRMTEAHALDLVAWLLSRGWGVEEHAEDGPFADLARIAALRKVGA